MTEKENVAGVEREAAAGRSPQSGAGFMTGAGPSARMPLDPDRNLALELVRATEAAAISSARYVGRGDKIQVDQAAVDAMRPVLGSVGMRGVVVIGEGEKDEAPMLFNGEQVGNGSEPHVDIAVDPVDGTTAAANGLPDAVAVVGLSERGTMFDPGPCVYMHKLVVPAAAAEAIDPAAPVADILAAVARALGKQHGELTVAVLDRPRHADMVSQIRAAGVAVKFLLDGDVAGAIAVGQPGSGVDVLMGIGGTPEAVIAACALRCSGGAMFGRLYPRNEDERAAALDFGHDLDRVLTTTDLVRGDNVFFAATGVTDGALLRGVRFEQEWITTQSLSMRSRSGAVRTIETRHDRARSNLISPGDRTDPGHRSKTDAKEQLT
jgi:fructose-1,6-bisphosphatase II